MCAMILKNVDPFVGLHCETTATGSLLKQLGINLSEPMLFGIGEGLGYIYWDMKIMPFPFIGGRVKPDILTKNICQHLQLDLLIKETSSIKKAWKNVATALEEGKMVGLKLDCYHLDYFTKKVHFAAHYVAMYGYDAAKAYLIDTAPQMKDTICTASLENLALARNEKGPMASKNLMYTIEKTAKTYDLKTIIKQAILNNAQMHLNPPISNLGYKGIKKTSVEIKKWFERSTDVKRDFQMTSTFMEGAGTGGALFRNLYRDFLKESYALLGLEVLHLAYEAFVEIAQNWTKVAQLFWEAGETGQIGHIQEAADILVALSEKEQTIFSLLQTRLDN